MDLREERVPPVVSYMGVSGSAGKDWVPAAVHCDPSGGVTEHRGDLMLL